MALKYMLILEWHCLVLNVPWSS